MFLRLIRVFVICLLLAGIFLWGFLVHRNHVFPYQLLELIRPPQEVMIDRDPAESGLHLLKGMPYARGTFDPEWGDAGVLRHDRERAEDGLNLYCSSEGRTAFLMAMDGRTVHKWSRDSGPWQHVELLPDGSLLVLVVGREIFKLDPNSKLLWSVEGSFHHAFTIRADGRIWALRKDLRVAPEVHSEVAVTDSEVVSLSAKGEVLSAISLLDAFLNSEFAFLIPRLTRYPAHRIPSWGPGPKKIDLLHVNHVEELTVDLPEAGPAFKRGNLLVSLRNVNTIAILDPESRRIVWAWGANNVRGQHHSQLLPNGNILLFNNGATHSEILELDPRTGGFAWTYAPEEGFFTETRGSVQRLSNGNTLITESNRGRAREITPDGDIVWEFASPEVTDDQLRLALWRMWRVDPAELKFLPE